MEVEVTNVSPHGFWLLIGQRERFVSFKDFPWFRDASIGQLASVELPGPGHLYWPELDIDLAVDSLDSLARYPLISRVQRAAGRKREAVGVQKSPTPHGPRLPVRTVATPRQARRRPPGRPARA